MPRASAYSEEIVEIPTNVSVNKKGYVYYNADTYWTDSKDKSHKYAGHTKVCIGKILIPGSDWTDDPRMHPNSNYYRLFDVEKRPSGSANTSENFLPLFSQQADRSLY